MKIIVIDAEPQFVYTYIMVTGGKFLELNGLRKRQDESYTLEVRQNPEMWYNWERFLETDRSIDNFFGVNALIAVKGHYERSFTIRRTQILISGRKEVCC